MFENNINEQYREYFVRESLLSDEFLDFMKRNRIPFETLISYYRCAVMEIETKFKVLDEQYALRYDRNPIESIKYRVKSMESLLKKIRKKEIPIYLQDEKKNMKVEIQLRTIAMDFWASLEHKLRYKKNLTPDQVEILAHELEECAQISADLDVRMQNIRSSIYEEDNPIKYEDMPWTMPRINLPSKLSLLGNVSSFDN